MSASANQHVVYEHPLNERIRTLMRLEFLLDSGRTAATGESEVASRVAIESLVNVLSVLDRGDVRSELIKELDRLAGGLSREQETTSIPRKEDIEQCRTLLSRIGDPGAAALGQELRNDELLSTIAQRYAIGAGTCSFDLPGFHRWLSLPHELRQSDLERWFEQIRDLYAAIALALRLQRDSASFEPQQAQDGQWQYRPAMDERAVQMLRVRVPQHHPLFPEIGGNRHLITLRFLAQRDTLTRPEATDETVDFELAVCDL